MFSTYVYNCKLEYIHIYHNLSHSTKTSNYQNESLLTFHIFHIVVTFQTYPLTSITRWINFCMESYYTVDESPEVFFDNALDKFREYMPNWPLSQYSSQRQSKISDWIVIMRYLIFSSWLAIAGILWNSSLDNFLLPLHILKWLVATPLLTTSC